MSQHSARKISFLIADFGIDDRNILKHSLWVFIPVHVTINVVAFLAKLAAAKFLHSDLVEVPSMGNCKLFGCNPEELKSFC